MTSYARITHSATRPRGLVTGTAAALAVVWGLYAVAPDAWPGLPGAVVQTVLLLANVVLTTHCRRAKQAVVRRLQRHLVNPAVRALLAVGLNPLGLALLETTGRTSGRPRRTPVGARRVGDVVWVIAEHGERAGWVRNAAAHPEVRLRLRVGCRLTWVTGVAEALPDDDAVARQRAIVGWHPLRALNAMNVRVLGTDLLSVRIRLDEPAPRHGGEGDRSQARPLACAA